MLYQLLVFKKFYTALTISTDVVSAKKTHTRLGSFVATGPFSAMGKKEKKIINPRFFSCLNEARWLDGELPGNVRQRKLLDHVLCPPMINRICILSAARTLSCFQQAVIEFPFVSTTKAFSDSNETREKWKNQLNHIDRIFLLHYRINVVNEILRQVAS